MCFAGCVSCGGGRKEGRSLLSFLMDAAAAILCVCVCDGGGGVSVRRGMNG